MIEDEPLSIDPGAWRKLSGLIDNSAHRATVVAHHARGRGKSWTPWLWMCRETLFPTPAQELRAACEWAVKDTGKPSSKIVVQPRVFPGCSSGRDVA